MIGGLRLSVNLSMVDESLPELTNKQIKQFIKNLDNWEFNLYADEWQRKHPELLPAIRKPKVLWNLKKLTKLKAARPKEIPITD